MCGIAGEVRFDGQDADVARGRADQRGHAPARARTAPACTRWAGWRSGTAG